MRHILISCLIMLAAATTATASDRYPSARSYVTQTGQVVTIGQAAHNVAYVPVRRALPAVQIVPVVQAPRLQAPRLQAQRPLAQPVPRLVAVKNSAPFGKAGMIDDNSAEWPSGRKCCRPGQPYFNENPNS